MNAVAINPMAELYRRLRAVGFTKKFVQRTILPYWWDDAIADNPAGFAEGLLYLSRHAGLDLASLRDPSRTVAFREFGVCKFKLSKGVHPDLLTLARAMATRAAQLAAEAMTEPIVPTPKSGAIMREEILGMGKRWVGFEELLDYSWSLGIPVLHVSGFPKSAKKPHGLTLKIKDRPVIVLCVKRDSPPWLSFILAHELGHVCLGHIENNGCLLDDDVNANERDAEEDAANAFAVELLTGSSEPLFSNFGSQWPNEGELARWAKDTGSELRIDPGHLVLNLAHSIGNGFWRVASASMKHLRSSEGALELVRNRVAARLDWSRLPEQSSRFLLEIMKAPREEPDS